MCFYFEKIFKLYINSVLILDPLTGLVNQVYKLLDIYISHNYVAENGQMRNRQKPPSPPTVCHQHSLPSQSSCTISMALVSMEIDGYLGDGSKSPYWCRGRCRNFPFKAPFLNV